MSKLTVFPGQFSGLQILTCLLPSESGLSSDPLGRKMLRLIHGHIFLLSVERREL